MFPWFPQSAAYKRITQVVVKGYQIKIIHICNLDDLLVSSRHLLRPQTYFYPQPPSPSRSAASSFPVTSLLAAPRGLGAEVAHGGGGGAEGASS